MNVGVGEQGPNLNCKALLSTIFFFMDCIYLFILFRVMGSTSEPGTCQETLSLSYFLDPRDTYLSIIKLVSKIMAIQAPLINYLSVKYQKYAIMIITQKHIQVNTHRKCQGADHILQ